MNILKEAHKESALHRAALYAGGPNEYVPKVFLDPQEARDRIDTAQAEEKAIDDATDELFDSLGFT